MSIEFKMPALGENVDKADIGQILVKEGDVIEKEQIVLELETEKAVFELPCPHAGKILKVLVKSGATVKVGTPILTIEEAAGAAAESKKPDSKPAESKKPDEKKAEEKKPTESKPVAAPAPPSALPGSSTAQPVTAPPMALSSSADKRIPAPAGPATRRLARELGIDLYQVGGSGSGGRITIDDVKAFVRNGHARGPSANGVAAGPAPALPDFSQFGTIEKQAMNKIAKTAAANLAYAWQSIPHVTQHDLADITDLEAARKKFVAARPKAPKITMTVLAMKACVAALKAFPHFNASIDLANGEVVHKKYYNIGIAVDTENGLLVPVIRNVDQKTPLQLAAELTEIAEKARNRKLGMADFQGGSFTISNLGGIGGTGFTPIVNYPEVAILGISRSRLEPTYIDGALQPRLMMPLSLSYDHRVINGADGARFLVKVVAMLTDMFELLAET